MKLLFWMLPSKSNANKKGVKGNYKGSKCGGYTSLSEEGTFTTSTSLEMNNMSQSLCFNCNTIKKIAKEQQRSTRKDSVCVINEVGTVKTSTAVGSNSSQLNMTRKFTAPGKSINEGIVEKFIECFSNQDADGCIAIKSPQCEWRFSGKVSVVIKDFDDMIQKIMNSFPDFSFDFDEVVEIRPGIVQVKDAVASGTHTGQPFGFHSYEPLPANGVKCVNDMEHLNFYMYNGKIVQVHIVCTGKYCGPIGLYKQVKKGQASRGQGRENSARQIRCGTSEQSRSMAASAA